MNRAKSIQQGKFLRAFLITAALASFAAVPVNLREQEKGLAAANLMLGISAGILSLYGHKKTREMS